MGILFLVIFFFVSFLIVGLVLLQEGKGGGLTGMSTGMDGVMGAKNPLRRMTAYLFVFFVVMAVTINWYFHQRVDSSLPAGAPIPQSPVRVLEETEPAPGPVVLPQEESAPSESAAAEQPDAEQSAAGTEKNE